MREYVFDSVVDSILLERNKMKNLPLTILADKGDGRKEREGTNFVKLVAKYCHETNEVDVTCIRISSTGNNSRSAAENIHHSLQLYDTEDNHCALDSQGTDAGGGGTRQEKIWVGN